MNPVQTWITRQRGLTPVMRTVLYYYCGRANGDLTCFPSYSLAAKDCEIARRSVIYAVGQLCAGGQLAIVTDPNERVAILAKAGANHNSRVNIYRVNFDPTQANGATTAPPNSATTAPSVAHNGAAYAPTNSATIAPRRRRNGAKAAPNMVQSTHVGGATIAPELLNEKREPELKSGAGAPKQAKGLSFGEEGKEARTPPPSPPTATTPGGDTFNAYLDAPNPARAIPAEIEQEVIRADPLDLPVDPEYVRATVTELKHEWRMRAYPGRAATMSREDQTDAVLGKSQPKPHHLTGTYLAMRRKQAGIRHANA
jgi:hypothetical protein